MSFFHNLHETIMCQSNIKKMIAWTDLVTFNLYDIQVSVLLMLGRIIVLWKIIQKNIGVYCILESIW